MLLTRTMIRWCECENFVPANGDETQWYFLPFNDDDAWLLAHVLDLGSRSMLGVVSFASVLHNSFSLSPLLLQYSSCASGWCFALVSMFNHGVIESVRGRLYIGAMFLFGGKAPRMGGKMAHQRTARDNKLALGMALALALAWTWGIGMGIGLFLFFFFSFSLLQGQRLCGIGV